MRYQEKIYNNNGVCVINSSINNVNMSSDICIFNAPTFDIDGGSKIGSLTTNSVYIVDNNDLDNIELTFEFISSNSLLTGDTNFKYEVYKYNNNQKTFNKPALYKSDKYSGTNIVTDNIPVKTLKMDGEYLIKGYYEHEVCTGVLGELGLKNDTSYYKSGSEYGMYNSSKDYYMVVISKAQEPIIRGGDNNNRTPIGSLIARSVLPTPSTDEINIDNNIRGDLMLYLNGILLSESLDYDVNENIIKLKDKTIEDDIITYVYVKDSESDGVTVDNININDAIPSGVTGGQNSSKYYYNTSEGKYEIYTELTPIDGGDIVVTLNGVTLANGMDYYQSITNPKRIILEGDLIVGDIINIIYESSPQYVGDVYTNKPIIHWTVSEAPEKNNGRFVVETATDMAFNNIKHSATTEYVGGVNAYSTNITITGTLGTKLFYRVINEKEFETINDGIIKTTGVSEIIPITIMSNSINSY